MLRVAFGEHLILDDVASQAKCVAWFVGQSSLAAVRVFKRQSEGVPSEQPI